jgi:hypothetical protein
MYINRFTFYFQVCAAHFVKTDIRTTASGTDSRTGEVITVALDIQRLIPGAIPSQLPSCPAYLSKPQKTPRTSLSDKMSRIENQQLARALEISKSEYVEQQENDHFNSLDELKSKLCVDDQWMIKNETNRMTISYVSYMESDGPKISCAVTISDSLIATGYIHGVKVPLIKSTPMPIKVDKVSNLMDILENAEQIVQSTNENSERPADDGEFMRCLSLILALLLPFRIP